MSMAFLLGADPEVFVREESGNPISAHGMIKGTKKKPFKVKNGAVQVDGHALEFNINPAPDAETFVHNIQSVFKTLEKMIPEGHKLDVSASMEFSPSYLKTLPKEANELGCDPDYNAYTGHVNPRPNGATALRTAAGHVHIGWTKDMDVADPGHTLKCQQLVKQLDWFLGVPSLFLDPDTKRRTLYGAAGAYRPKPYGVEYRVLSNFWLKDPILIEWVFSQTMLAINHLLKGENFSEMIGLSANYIIDRKEVLQNNYYLTRLDKNEIHGYFSNTNIKHYRYIRKTFEHLLKK